MLRRHVSGNLAAFHRWYADPAIARLARYQEAPMRPMVILLGIILGTAGAIFGTFATGFVLIAAFPTRPIVIFVGDHPFSDD